MTMTKFIKIDVIEDIEKETTSTMYINNDYIEAFGDENGTVILKTHNELEYQTLNTIDEILEQIWSAQ